MPRPGAVILGPLAPAPGDRGDHKGRPTSLAEAKAGCTPRVGCACLLVAQVRQRLIFLGRHQAAALPAEGDFPRKRPRAPEIGLFPDIRR